MTIKNIIIDLGGVIINLDHQLTKDAFKQLGASEDKYTEISKTSLFTDYEKGNITSAQFRSRCMEALDLECSDEQFDTAWNALLLDLPIQRLNFIQGLRENYRVFLFSNTNEIHLNKVFQICQKENGFNNFGPYFEKEYYSYQFHKMKPHPESFIALLNENNLIAEETLFIDDTLVHVNGARQAGIHAVQITAEHPLFDIHKFINTINEEHFTNEKSKPLFVMS